ncbi:hypothetical protein UT300003_33150 [Clostridium sardiniense]
MEQELITQIMTQGAFAGLFVWLLFDTRKEARESRQESKEREEKYQIIIENLTDKLNIVEEIKEKVDGLENKISDQKRKD